MAVNTTEDHTGVWSIRLESREIIFKHERAVIIRIHLKKNRGKYHMTGVSCV